MKTPVEIALELSIVARYLSTSQIMAFSCPASLVKVLFNRGMFSASRNTTPLILQGYAYEVLVSPNSPFDEYIIQIT